MSSSLSFDDYIRKRTGEVMTHLKSVREMIDYESAYVFGGIHRVWLIKHAKALVDAYIANIEGTIPIQGVMSRDGGRIMVATPNYIKLKLRLPEPSSWDSVRPEWATCAWSGTSEYKDALNYERAIRKFFADKFLYADTTIADGGKTIYVSVHSPIHTIYLGGERVKDWPNTETTPLDVPMPPYDDSVLEGTGVTA